MSDTCGALNGGCRELLVELLVDLTAHWQPLLLWASGASLLLFLATLVAVPLVVTRLPADYFVRPTRSEWRKSSQLPLATACFGALKNLVGLVLVVLGAVMLVTPGQGLLTLLVGLLLMNFPGKYRLERWLVLRPGMLPALNWLRRRQGHEEFERPL